MSREGAELTRRLDWRFLLPRATFRRAVLFGSTPALRDHAVRIGLATVVDDATDGSPPDLILMSPDDDFAYLDDLAPDGVVCIQVDRRRARLLTPDRLAKQLHEVGLHPSGTWAVRPGLERAESYVPLDQAQPLPWYLQTQYRAMTVAQRVAVAGVKAFVGRDGRRFAPIAPFYVMVATKPAALVNTGDDDGSTIVLTDSGDRATCLWFPPGDTAPRVVTKIPKSEAFVERTRREQLAMVDLHRRLPEDIAEALPTPLGLSPWGEVTASRESVVPGVSFATRCRRGRRHIDNARRDLLAASDWLARFHIATRNDEMDVACEVVDLCDQYLARFGCPGSGMIDVIRAAAPHLPPIRSVIRHPDFNVWNLVRDGNRIHVIDWEGAAPGPPLCDLVQFTVHWHECATRRRPHMPDEDGLRVLLAERSHAAWADAAVADVFNRYMSRLGIADEWFDVLAVTAWVERALRREQQLVDAGCSRGERDRNNFGVRYIEALSRGWHRAPSEVTGKVAGEVGVA
jgi:hypothetical protein